MMTDDEKFMRQLRKTRRKMYEETKDMTDEEWVAYHRKEGGRIIKELGLERFVLHELEPVNNNESLQ
jgi:hypothetical protein